MGGEWKVLPVEMVSILTEDINYTVLIILLILSQA